MDALANCSASAKDSRISRMLKTAGAAAGGGNPGLLPDVFIPDEWIKRNFFQRLSLFSPARQINLKRTKRKAPGALVKF